MNKYSILRKPLFGLAKRQLPRTLCAMGKYFENYEIYKLDKKYI